MSVKVIRSLGQVTINNLSKNPIYIGGDSKTGYKIPSGSMMNLNDPETIEVHDMISFSEVARILQESRAELAVCLTSSDRTERLLAELFLRRIEDEVALAKGS